MATPEELRAAADAFAKLGKPEPDPFDFGAMFNDATADARALVDAAARGDKAEADRIRARMEAAHPDDDDDEDDE